MEFQQLKQMYDDCISRRESHKPLWKEISKYCGIGVDPDYSWNGQRSGKSGQARDEDVDDPTSAIAVNQSGDYLVGIMWGADAFDIVPSRYVQEYNVDSEHDREGYYRFCTEQALYHMNHAEAGLNTALRAYAYDQAAFGTSGVGAFHNQSFVSKIDDNALIFRQYGVDNLAIDEGKSGQIDTMFVTYHWCIGRIVREFCNIDGTISAKSVATLPKPMRDAWSKQNTSEVFKVMLGVMPREDYDPRVKGKRGARYKGCWFTDEGKFHEEDYFTKPIAVARAVKVRGEVWGRAYGTMLLSSIRGVNFIVGRIMEILDKMSEPSLGIFNNALFGDSVLDTSAGGMTVFNSNLAQGSGNPIFPLYDVGDPSGIIQFLIPYLNEKIASGFKVDLLLDFNASADMTATESLQRYTIRGKSIAGMLTQHKQEMLETVTRRSISLLGREDVAQLGVPSGTTDAERLRSAGVPQRIIPPEVAQVIAGGRSWYDIRWNTEMERLINTEALQRLLQLIQSIGSIASMYPNIIEAVDWHKLLSDINNNLDANNQIVISADKFREALEVAAAQQQEMMQMQGAGAQAQIAKTMSEAQKNERSK